MLRESGTGCTWGGFEWHFGEFILLIFMYAGILTEERHGHSEGGYHELLIIISCDRSKQRNKE